MEEKAITALFIGNRDCTEVNAEDIEKAIVKAIESGIGFFLICFLIAKVQTKYLI